MELNFFELKQEGTSVADVREEIYITSQICSEVCGY